MTAPSQTELDQIFTWYQQGQYVAARDKCEMLLSQYPAHVQLWTLLGATQMQHRDFDAAVDTFRTAITYDPNSAAQYNNLGIALLNLQAFDEAARALEFALQLKPDQAHIYNNLGKAYESMGAWGRAVTAFRNAIDIQPDFADALNGLGSALRETYALEEALTAYGMLIELRPDSPEGHYNIGRVYMHLNRVDDAISAYEHALKLRPDLVEAHCNLAVAFNANGQFKEATASYEAALQRNPTSVNAREGQAFMALQHGSLRKGFKEMEWRLQKMDRASARPARSHLSWANLTDLQGVRLLVYEEQGLGDTLQFCRYLPLLAAQGATVTFKVTARLHHLLAHLPNAPRLVAEVPPEPEIDVETPLMSLPYRLGTTVGTIPAEVPYLSASLERMAYWRDRLPADGFKIGVCWQGSIHRVDAGRSFPLTCFQPLTTLPGAQLISLHKGVGERQLANVNFEVTTLGPDFDSGPNAFADTAAVMMHCDLIITSDTAIAHLAGALGRQTWVALKYVPDWRWMLERSDSPWYPTMTLYRQKARDDWNTVFEEIRADLKILLHERGV